MKILTSRVLNLRTHENKGLSSGLGTSFFTYQLNVRFPGSSFFRNSNLSRGWRFFFLWEQASFPIAKVSYGSQSAGYKKEEKIIEVTQFLVFMINKQ